MEKSLEAIWRDGFLEDDALVAPVVNDLYNQKSIHMIDKLKRMFKINLIAIPFLSLFILASSFLAQIPLMGIGFFIILNAIVIINVRLSASLKEIDKGMSSYEYIKAFDDWMKSKKSANRKMAGYYYPLMFLSTVLGFWYGNFVNTFSGSDVLTELLITFPNMEMFFGFPVIGIRIVIVITALLVLLGGRIYDWDVSLVYGRIFKKLDQLIGEMEELRK